jgi:hypothetical protein
MNTKAGALGRLERKTNFQVNNKLGFMKGIKKEYRQQMK